MKIRLSKSSGTKLSYGTVSPQDICFIGFNTRWGGYYLSLTSGEE